VVRPPGHAPDGDAEEPSLGVTQAAAG